MSLAPRNMSISTTKRPDLEKQLRDYCHESGRTISSTILDAIEEYLNKHNKQQGAVAEDGRQETQN